MICFFIKKLGCKWCDWSRYSWMVRPPSWMWGSLHPSILIPWLIKIQSDSALFEELILMIFRLYNFYGAKKFWWLEEFRSLKLKYRCYSDSIFGSSINYEYDALGRQRKCSFVWSSKNIFRAWNCHICMRDWTSWSALELELGSRAASWPAELLIK